MINIDNQNEKQYTQEELSNKSSLTIDELSEVMTFYYGMQSQLVSPQYNNDNLRKSNYQTTFKRSDITSYMENPDSHELPLRRMSYFLYKTQMTYKTLRNYYSRLLACDYTTYPIDASYDVMTKNSFKKSKDEVYNWFARFDMKDEFQKITDIVLSQDACFTYVRYFEDKISLMIMPTEYCIIDGNTPLGFVYSFNLDYFIRNNISTDGYPEEFRTYIRNAQKMENSIENKIYYDGLTKRQNRDGSYSYWQQIPLDKGWVFKFEPNDANIIPPLAPMFLDNRDLIDYRELQKDKNLVEAFKIISGQVPITKDGTNRTGNKKDDFAMSSSSAAKFMKLVNSGLPDGVKFIATPFDKVQDFDFEKTTDKDNLLSKSLENYYNLSGATSNLFDNSTGVYKTKASMQKDTNFVKHLYYQYQKFVNYHLQRVLNVQYKFAIKMEGFNVPDDRESRIKQANELLDKGIVVPEVGSAYGFEPHELEQKMAFMKSMNFVDKLTPVVSGYNLKQDNNTNNVGRDSLEDSKLTDAGEKTREVGSNIEKEN